MKLLSLNIKAFGPFTEKCLDFSGGQECFHIVYGPNEAGKTSALRALKALLFGIPERTPDVFMHEGRKLRIGARICHSDGTTLSFQRRKGRSKTLLTEDEVEISESELAKFLGSIDEAAFSLMFGLGHEDLVQGGREIVAGKGDLGQSLFAAGAGVSGLQKVLSGLEDEAAGLFKPRSQSAMINAAISKFKESKKEIQSASLPPKAWEDHDHSLNLALRNKEEVSERLRDLRKELNRLERIQRALPTISERKEVIAQREQLGEVLILPESFSSERLDVTNALQLAQEEKKKASDHLDRTTAKINFLNVPGELLNQETVITELHKKLGGHLKAMGDLPQLRIEMSSLRREAENILKDIRPGSTLGMAESLRLSVAKRQRILSLASEHQGLAERLDNAAEQIHSLETRKLSADAELRDIGEPVDVTALKRVIAHVQKDGEIEEQAAEASREQRQAEELTQIELRQLPMWDGTLEKLESLPIPQMETLERFEHDFEGLEKKLINLESLIKDKREDIAETERNIESLDIAGAVPTEAILLESRKRRDIGWSLVKASWLEQKTTEAEIKEFHPELPLDQAYEKSVGEADEIADRLRREAERVTQKALLLASGSQLKEDIEQLESDREALATSKRELEERWNLIWQPTGITPLPPKEMRGWVQKQQNLVTTAARNRLIHEKARRIEERISEHRLALTGCLYQLGEEKAEETETLRNLIDKSLSFVEANEDVKQRRTLLQHTLREIAAAFTDANKSGEDASKEFAKWKTEWETATGELGVETSLSPSAAIEFINRSQEFFEKLDKAQGLEERILGIEREGEKFATEVSHVVTRIAPDLDGLPAEEAAAELHGRLSKAREDSATLNSLKQERESHQKDFEDATDTISRMEDRLKILLDQAGCTRPEGVGEIERRSALAKAVDTSIEQLGKQLLAHASGATIDEFIAEAETLNPDSLPLEIKSAQDHIAKLSEELSALDQTIGSEQAELRNMDGAPLAAEAAEKAQTALAQIVDNSERYIGLRLASAILHAEIERYRARNQGPVLARAGQILASLTTGSFSRLKMAFDESDVPILVGVRPSPDESEVRVEGMSDGTCDQLYLSLRLASLERYMEQNEPMPFIIDDILVNFDDDRSEAALRVLAEISEKTQIIFFTHHRHILDLAEKSLPSDILKLHYL